MTTQASIGPDDEVLDEAFPLPTLTDGGPGFTTGRVVWSDPVQREAQIAVFVEWLPEILRDIEDIDWTNMPGRVMGKLLNTVQKDAWWGIPTILAAGVATSYGPAVATQYSRLAGVLMMWRYFEGYGSLQASCTKRA